MQKLTLKHNEPDSGIRRPNGISDEDWNWLITNTINFVYLSDKPTLFMLEMVKILLKNTSKKPFLSMLKALGIDTEKDILLQNWEHTTFRFFRHYCSEDYRNAINHSGLKFATLELSEKGFVWVSKMDVEIYRESEIFNIVKAKPGDKVSVVAEGLSDVETVTISNGDNVFQYYEKGRSKSFGDTMYLLKQAIIQNKKEALRSSTQKQNA